MSIEIRGPFAKEALDCRAPLIDVLALNGEAHSLSSAESRPPPPGPCDITRVHTSTPSPESEECIDAGTRIYSPIRQRAFEYGDRGDCARGHVTTASRPAGGRQWLQRAVVPHSVALRPPRAASHHFGPKIRLGGAEDDTVLVTDATPLRPPGLEIVYASDAFTEQMGFRADEIVGRTPTVLCGPDTDLTVLRSIQTQLPHGRGYRGEIMLYRKDGTPYLVKLNIAPVHDPKETIAHRVTVLKEETECTTDEPDYGTGMSLAPTVHAAIGALLEATTFQDVADELARLATQTLEFPVTRVRRRVDASLVGTSASADVDSPSRVELDQDHPAARAFRESTTVRTESHVHIPLGSHGVLSVENPLSRNTRSVGLLEMLASHATRVLDRIAQLTAERSQRRRAEALREVSQALLDASSGREGAEAAFEDLAPLFPDRARIRLFSFSPDNEMARVVAANDQPLDGLERGCVWPMHAGLQTFRTGDTSYAVADVDSASPPSALEQRLLTAGCRSYVAVPVPSDARDGILLLAAERPNAFAATHRMLAEDIAPLLAAALRRSAAREERVAPPEHGDVGSIESAFLATIHHELRTPLTSIIGFAEVIRQQEGENTDRFAELIGKSGRRLQQTFDALITLSRLKAGTLRVAPTSLSVTAEVRTAIDRLDRRARERSVSLDWTSTEESVDAVLDPKGLSDILDHLLDNAVKFTPAGGRIHVHVHSLNDSILVIVDDSGVGMDPSVVSDLRQPFQQVSTSLDRSHQGAGLGLAVVDRWIDAMGGTLDIETSPGAGTAVTVRLPKA